MTEIAKKLFYILPKGDPVKLVILFLLMLVAAGLEVAGIGMIPAFVSIVADPDRALNYEPLQQLYHALGISTGQDLLIWGSAALVGIFILKNIYIVSFNYLEARFIYNRRYRVSHRMMCSYMQAPYIFHLQRNSAELLRNIIGEVNILVNNVLTELLTIARESVMIISILIFLFIFEPLITLLVIFLAGVGAGTFLLMTRKRVKQYGKEEQGHRRNMIKAVNQGLGGIKDVRVLNREAELIEKFRTEAHKSSKLLTYVRYIKQIPKPVVETTAVIGMMLIAAILVWQGRPMSSIIPVLALFAMAIVRLMPALQSITSKYTKLIYDIVAVDPIYEDLLELEEHSNRFLADRKKTDSFKLQKQIEARDIYFHYPESDEQALNGVSFTIPKGKAVAFVGESGAGKTTIVDLLLGLIEPVNGSILVDGRDIHENISGWQRNIGYIPQSIYLADETLRNNIAFGLPEKEIDDEKVHQAVELAQLGTLVGNLPLGLDTIIGEHGTRLSGGQRQRVGIARALYHNPEVLVMDEATSALDNITEQLITQAIEALKGDRTIIMIAHRLTTVMNCDQLYLMENGKVIHQGTYNELIKTSEHFREMAMET